MLQRTAIIVQQQGPKNREMFPADLLGEIEKSTEKDLA